MSKPQPNSKKGSNAVDRSTVKVQEPKDTKRKKLYPAHQAPLESLDIALITSCSDFKNAQKKTPKQESFRHLLRNQRRQEDS